VQTPDRGALDFGAAMRDLDATTPGRRDARSRPAARMTPP